MNTGYTIYQVERTKSAAEQREVDRSNAELAAAISRLWCALGAPWRELAAPWRARRAARHRPVWVTAPRVSAETSHAIAWGVSAGTPGHAAMRSDPGPPARPGRRAGVSTHQWGRVTIGDPIQSRQASGPLPVMPGFRED